MTSSGEQTTLSSADMNSTFSLVLSIMHPDVRAILDAISQLEPAQRQSIILELSSRAHTVPADNTIVDP